MSVLCGYEIYVERKREEENWESCWRRKHSYGRTHEDEEKQLDEIHLSADFTGILDSKASSLCCTIYGSTHT